MDRLASMEVFVKVAQTGNFSVAANQLGMSKSTVSKHISALEAQLGVRLLNRTTRRLSLTESGEIFRDRSLRILEEVSAAEDEMDRFTSEPRGRLKVNAPMSFGMLHLAPLLPEFLQRFPKVDVDLTLNDRRVDLIDEGFDVAIRIGQLDDSNLIARRLASTSMVCAASPDYLKTHKAPQEPSDLKSHNCLIYSLARSSNDWLFTRGPEIHRIAAAGRMRGNNGDILRTAAILGEGIVYLPCFLLTEALETGQLVPLLEDWTTEKIDIYAVYPESRHVASKLRVFIDQLAGAYRGRDHWRPEHQNR